MLKMMIPYIPEQGSQLRGLVVMLEAIGFTATKTDLMWILEITEEAMTQWTKRTGMPSWNMEGVPTPRTIMELARRDPTMNAVLELWKSGQIAWEQALMMAVCCMSVDKGRYQDQLIKMKTEEVAPIIVPMCRDPQHQKEFLESLKLPPAGP